MTLLIKGMEMPEDGMIGVFISSDRNVYDSMDNIIGTIVPVSTPHGRLGDLDDLKECIDYVTDDCTCPLHIAAELYQYMDHAPTIIEAEE